MASVAERSGVQAGQGTGFVSLPKGAMPPVKWQVDYISERPAFVVAVYSCVRTHTAQASIRPCGGAAKPFNEIH